MRQVHPSRFDRIAERATLPGLHLNECHGPLPLDHEIDVTVPAPESPLDDPPSLAPEPPLRDPLSQLAELLPGR